MHFFLSPAFKKSPFSSREIFFVTLNPMPSSLSLLICWQITITLISGIQKGMKVTFVTRDCVKLWHFSVVKKKYSHLSTSQVSKGKLPKWWNSAVESFFFYMSIFPPLGYTTFKGMRTFWLKLIDMHHLKYKLSFFDSM